MIQLGLIGHPVAHSRSPEMHQAALKELNIEGRYTAIDVTDAQLEDCIQRCREQGFVGLNVTIPHKIRALGICDELASSAQSVGAVNTLLFRSDGSVLGSNTDLPGFLASCPNSGQSLDKERALVIGAGGAARGVLAALKSAQCGKIYLSNRNFQTSQHLATEFDAEHYRLDRKTLSSLAPTLVINATSVGMSVQEDSTQWAESIEFFSQFPFELWHSPRVIDLIYTPTKTAFLHRAEQAGCIGVNGLPMLAHQGAVSLSQWIGKPIKSTLGAMRRTLGLE